MDLYTALLSTRARETTTTTTTTPPPPPPPPPTGRPTGAGADLVNGVPWRLWLWPCVPGVIPGVPDVVATVKVLFPIHDGVGWLFGLSTPSVLVYKISGAVRPPKTH